MVGAPRPSWSARLCSALESPRAFHTALALAALAIALGLKRYLVWDQIMTLEGSGLWEMFATRHPHALRWLLMQPAMAFGEVGDPHLAFGVMCFLYLLGTAVLLARAGAWTVTAGGALRDALREQALRVWLFVPLALLSLAMNGRLVPAFFGVALLIALHVERAAGVPRRMPWLVAGELLGLLCCAVSSGAFAVGAATVVWSWGTALAGAARGRRLPLVIGVVLAVVVLGGLGAALFAKALRYFSGGWSDLLGHGPGGLLLPHGTPVTLAGLALWCVAATVWWWRWRQPAVGGSHVRVAVWASLVCGVFGYGTLVSAAPAVLLLAVLPLAGALRGPLAADRPAAPGAAG